MAKTIPVREKAIKDLLRVKEECDDLVESIELVSDESFMKFRKGSKA